MIAAPPEVEQLARDLVRATGTGDVAFLQDGPRVLAARGPADARSPFTATTTLVQAIYELAPEVARKVVRNRIWTTREPGAFAAGLVKVAGRRLSVVEPRDHGLAVAPPVEELRYEPRPGRGTLVVDPVPGPDAGPRAWLERALALVPPRDPTRPLFERDRAVAAIVVSPAGEVLAASANANARNRTLHAELNALTTAWLATRRKLPRGTRLYTTLAPCKMCAGLAWELGESPGGLEVSFAQDDPGPAARDTVLERGSNARRRFARDAEERARECLFRIPLA